jgi:4-amino-4-deoxy-L-arabinose transferase-like glycosyltransferase
VRRIPLPLALLLALALLQGAAWALLTAPLQGPDELAHASYAQHLAETGHGPHKSTGKGSTSTEIGRAGEELNLIPIFGHVEGRPTWAAIGAEKRALAALPDAARKDGSGPNAVAQNPPLYYVYEAIAYRLSPARSLFGRLMAMRLASVLLYVLGVAFAWLVAAELFAREWLRFLATAVVVLQPKLASMAGIVNADTLLFTVSTGFLAAGLRLLRLGPSPGRLAAVAGLAGLGALTHGRGLFLIPPALLVIALACLRPRRLPWRRGLRLLAPAAAALAGCLLIAWLWTRADSGGSAFGGEVSQATTQSFSLGQFGSYLWQFYFPKLSFMAPMIGPPYGYRQVYVETFWGAFANLEINFRPAVYDWLQVLSFLGLGALWTAIVARVGAVRERWPQVLFALVSLASLLALLHISSYRDLQGGGGDPLITGRYLLPCIALFGAAIAWVAGSLPRRLAPAAGAVLLSGFVLLDVEGLLVMVQRFYA